MHFLGACFFLLLTPSGRASQVAFIVGGTIIRLVATFLANYVICAPEDAPAGSLTFIAIFAAWMAFCLFSRRLHDVGMSNALLIPLMLAEVILLLSVIETGWILRSEDPIQTVAMLLIASKLINIAYGLLGLYLCKSPGDTGDNAYGPPFGDAPQTMPGSASGAKAARSSAPAASAIEQRYPFLNKKSSTVAKENPGGGLPQRKPRLQNAGPKRFGGR